MARNTKHEAPRALESDVMRGLYQRGNVWWIARVRSPIDPALYKPLTTGTSNAVLACSIRDMAGEWRENGSERQREWLHRALTEPRTVRLLDLYNASKRDGLEVFAKAIDAAKADARDGDLDQLVTEWIENDLMKRKKLRERTRADYVRQARYFIPDGRRFPKSKLTEQYVRDRLAQLTGARHDDAADVRGGTQRNYLVGLSQFVNYAMRVRVLPLNDNPLAFAGGQNGWAPSRHTRSTYYDYPDVRAILAQMEQHPEAHAAMAMIFGSGIELGGVNDQKRMHLGETLDDGRGVIKVPGADSGVSKSDRKDKAGKSYRSERTIFVDAWAWAIVRPFADTRAYLPKTPLWSWHEDPTAKPLRDAFYRAQVAAGYIDEPPKTASRKPKWSAVQVHTIHDARHSFCVNRSLGADGEPPRSAAYCAMQLGHGSEQMVHTVYKKAGIEERVRTLQTAELLKEAQRLAAGGAR